MARKTLQTKDETPLIAVIEKRHRGHKDRLGGRGVAQEMCHGACDGSVFEAVGGVREGKRSPHRRMAEIEGRVDRHLQAVDLTTTRLGG